VFGRLGKIPVTCLKDEFFSSLLGKPLGIESISRDQPPGSLPPVTTPIREMFDDGCVGGERRHEKGEGDGKPD
jgi:hypothetical protein